LHDKHVIASKFRPIYRKKSDKPPKRKKNVFYQWLAHHIQHIRHVDVPIDIKYCCWMSVISYFPYACFNKMILSFFDTTRLSRYRCVWVSKCTHNAPNRGASHRIFFSFFFSSFISPHTPTVLFHMLPRKRPKRIFFYFFPFHLIYDLADEFNKYY
jgi:hypothetical protein